MTKRLDHKLRCIADGTYAPRDFIIADAKDGDMGFGLTAPGPERWRDGTRTGRIKSRADYLAQIGEIVRQDIVDVMLMSASNGERLVEQGVFADSAVTPAVRANDSTDIWTMRHGVYRQGPSRPFRSADLARVKALGCDLCLYSITFVNDLDHDLRTLEAFRAFRDDAARFGIRYFLEVFNPNVDAGVPPGEVGCFVNDCIARCLAGVTSADRPLFLKIVYNGARALEELCHYDDTLVVGVLGGSAGTTRDTFELLKQASGHGAKVALFGRKINLAESPLDIVRLMPAVVAGTVSPADAVQVYHDALSKAGITPARDITTDLEVTEAVLRVGM